MIKINTAMRSAFENLKVKASAYTPKGAYIGQRIQGNLEDGVGQMKVNDWNAHLSFKTAQKLGMKDGCTNPYAHMPYDDMVQA